MEATPSQLKTAYQTEEVKLQCSSRCVVDSSDRWQKTHAFDSGGLITPRSARFTRDGILSRNTCQANAHTFDGAELLQLSKKLELSKPVGNKTGGSNLTNML
jgi:hypothetical protein